MVEFVDDKRVEYDSRFSVCGDGHVLQTIKYETANNGSMDLSTSINVLHNGQSLGAVYKSPTLDIDIQIGSETNGYYPGCEDFYHEHLFGKDIHAHRWQLRCVKARVQNLMKNGIQNLICMHFNLLFCKNHRNFDSKCKSPLLKLWLKNFSNFFSAHAQIHKNINCQFRTRFLSFTKIIFIGC